MLTAKLLVAAGAPLQLNAGDRLPPLQPNPLNTCSLTMLAPSLMSALVNVIFCAFAALAPHALKLSTAIQIPSFAMVILPFDEPGFEPRPVDGSHSNFRDGVKASKTLPERPRRNGQCPEEVMDDTT